MGTGGGTLDVSVIRIKGHSIIEVKGTSGDMHLGGEDFTNKMVTFITKEIQRRKKTWAPDVEYVHNLRNARELAKLTLASCDPATIDAKMLTDTDGKTFNYVKKITLEQFDEMNDDLFKRAMNKVDEAIANVPTINASNIDEIILVGGSSRIIKIQKLLAAKLPEAKLRKNIDPDLAGK